MSGFRWLIRATFARTAAVGLILLWTSPLLAQDPGALDPVVVEFRGRATFWADSFHPIALRTFVLVSGIEFAVSAVLWVLASKTDVYDVQEEFLRKFSFAAFWYALLWTWEQWIPPIFNSFTTAGKIGARIGTLNPSTIVDIGISIWEGMERAAIDTLNPFSGVMMDVAALITLIGFIVAAVAVTYTIMQGWLIMGAGVLFLGFAGWRSTAQLADNYLNTLLYVGVKLMTLYLVVGVGIMFGNDMVIALRGVQWTDFSPAAWCMVASFVFATTVVGLPVFFATRITQGHSFGLVNAIRSKRE